MDNKIFKNLKEQFVSNKLLGILCILGIVLLVLSRMLTGSDKTTVQPSADVEYEITESYEEKIQQELEEILSSISGVGKAKVMVTLDTGNEKVVAKNITESERATLEEDTEGGIREIVDYNYKGELVILRKTAGDEPLVIKEIKPKVRGVLVVCPGGGNPNIQKQVIRAVQGVLDIPTYRINVMPKK
ncbi:hypothetical protein PRVXH_001728 [Proteinivorax hydrogeniformans]|uniref:Stage III sporulation protein AG n=1 Tax=Proteinivorax hydrogeniformans TaxID=1826727 RepID=A0AAU8HQX6_9FIRM